MFNKKRITIFGVFLAVMFTFITFAGGTSQNQEVATRDVTFIDSYNNEELKSEKVVVGEDAVAPADPSHDEMIFLGWYLDENRDKKITDFTNITEDIKVVALYGEDKNKNGIDDKEEARYTVTFIDSFDGSIISRQTVLTGLNALAPTPNSHDNLVFTGWTASYINITRDITIYTVYRNTSVVETVNYYNVTFLDTITNEIIESVRVREGLTANLPETKEHDGYLFTGWDGDYTNVTSDRVIITIYVEDINNNKIDDSTEPRYTLSFTEGEHGQLSGEVTYDNLLINQTLKDIVVPTVNADEFYTFNKFIDENGEEFSIDNVVTGDMTYKAIYTPDKDENNNGIHDDEEYFQVTVNVIGGSVDEIEKNVQYGMNETFTITPDIDHTLNLAITSNGCIIDENTGILTIENVKENITCTVTLELDTNPKDGIADRIQYQVIYNKNLSNVTGDAPTDNNYYIKNDTVTVLDNTNLTLENGKFLGWSKTPLELLKSEEDYLNNIDNIILPGSTMEFTETDTNIILYAVFASTHTVKYNYNNLDENGNVVNIEVENKVLDGTILDTEFVQPNDYKTLTNKYVFNNWINKDTNEIITGNYKVNSDLNLKAEYKKYVTIKFIGANGSLERDILAGENAVLENNDILTLPNHTFIGWDKTLENIEVNTVFNAKYMANIIGLDLTQNNIVFNKGLTEETLKSSLTVTPKYGETNYNPSLITKESLNYTINGFNNNVGVHNASVNFKNISKPFTYTVVDNNISNQIANSTGTLREAGNSYEITTPLRWDTKGRAFCINSNSPCNKPNLAGMRYSTTLETINYNFIELYFASLEEAIPENISSRGTVYYTDGTSAPVSIKKMNYSVYVGGYMITPTFRDVKLIISGLNDTNIVTNKKVKFVELPYVENGVSHKAIYKNNNGTFTVVK